MADQLHDIASKLDSQLVKMFGDPKSPEGSSMNAEVISILKEGGCADAEGTLAKIEAAGFKIEKSGEPEGEEPMPEGMDEEKEPEGDMPDFGAELAKMPMKDARNGAAKAAFGSMGK
jgi:hypothetical protein